MYLLDTNVWLERLLDRTRASEVARFLTLVPADELHLTDFTFHSIGVVLTKLNQAPAFLQFVDEVLVSASAHLIGLQPQDMSAVMDTATRHRLDFDDAYQYVTAEKLDLQLVTFDSDFDRTPRRGVSPGQITSALDEPSTPPG